MIEVKALTKRYRDLVAVDSINFEVKAGEILGFLGPNGAGKTTTMRMLAGFLPPSSGSAKVAGFDIFEEPLEVKRRIGYLPEQPPVYLDLTAAGYLRFVAEIKGIPGARIADEVERVAHMTNTDHILGRVIGNLSKGYKQRVGLAQALLGDPDVLILDEPTVGLDPHQIIEVRKLIKSLAGKHTIILSTHILPEVTAACQKVLIINKGQIVAYDDLEKLSQQHQLKNLEEIFLKLTGDIVDATASAAA